MRSNVLRIGRAISHQRRTLEGRRLSAIGYRLSAIIVVLLLLAGAAPATPARALAPLAPAAVPASPPSFGLNSHLASRYPDPSSMDVPASMLTDLGVTWVREDFHWHRVEPRPDAWDWTFTDAAMRAILSRDIQVLGVLGPSVGWGTPYPGDTPNDVSYYPPDPDAFDAYVRAVVTRYRRYIHHWEIWNEPDHGVFWRPQPDVAAYTRLLIRTAATIRAIDPQAQVVLGGINPFDTTFLRGVAENGGWGSFDVLGIHPYVDPYGPEDGNLIAAADGVRALAERYGKRPIWVTELGWSSGPGDRDRAGLTDEQAQASYLVRSMLDLWQAGVERIFWYSFKDDPGNPYGLVRAGAGRTDYRSRKPAYDALRTLNQQLAGATFVERRDLFTRDTLVSFDSLRGWRRTSQPNGTLRLSDAQAHGGGLSAQLDYSFTTRQNDYVSFEREQPIPLPGQPYALGVWVYGDGSTHGVKVWLRDAEGELLQYVLGSVGPPGWHFISAPIGGTVEPGNHLEGRGNSRLDFPASLQAVVLDDMVDSFVGGGTIYLDDLSVIGGHEIYDLRLQRGGESLDVLWSPPGARVHLSTRSAAGRLITRDGVESTASAQGGQITVNLGPAPVYLIHRR
ncbi:glycosyl hydrolase [Oscillochloris sp. ZM17-4]|nr:glycosyl hydrolase [Oscillochloris sp. ZM17-4]